METHDSYLSSGCHPFTSSKLQGLRTTSFLGRSHCGIYFAIVFVLFYIVGFRRRSLFFLLLELGFLLSFSLQFFPFLRLIRLDLPGIDTPPHLRLARPNQNLDITWLKRLRILLSPPRNSTSLTHNPPRPFSPTLATYSPRSASSDWGLTGAARPLRNGTSSHPRAGVNILRILICLPFGVRPPNTH